MPRSDMNEREFISAIKKCALADLPRKLPIDAEKTEQDWSEAERQSQWRQDAFNEFFVVGSAFLDATKGGLQTSRDMHMFCQGFASAVSALNESKVKIDHDGQNYRLAPFCEHMTQGGAHDLAKGVRGALLKAIQNDFERRFRTKISLKKQNNFIDGLHRIITVELTEILLHGWCNYDDDANAA